MSSRAKAKQARRESRGREVLGAAPSTTPLSVAVAAGGLAAFVALRGVDLEEKWGTNLFAGTVISELVPLAFVVLLLRGDKWAYVAARWGSLLIAVLLVAGAFLGYPYPQTRLMALAAALAVTFAMLSTPSAKQHYAGVK